MNVYRRSIHTLPFGATALLATSLAAQVAGPAAPVAPDPDHKVVINAEHGTWEETPLAGKSEHDSKVHKIYDGYGNLAGFADVSLWLASTRLSGIAGAYDHSWGGTPQAGVALSGSDDNSLFVYTPNAAGAKGTVRVTGRQDVAASGNLTNATAQIYMRGKYHYSVTPGVIDKTSEATCAGSTSGSTTASFKGVTITMPGASAGALVPDAKGANLNTITHQKDEILREVEFEGTSYALANDWSPGVAECTGSMSGSCSSTIYLADTAPPQ